MMNSKEAKIGMIVQYTGIVGNDSCTPFVGELCEIIDIRGPRVRFKKQIRGDTEWNTSYAELTMISTKNVIEVLNREI